MSVQHSQQGTQPTTLRFQINVPEEVALKYREGRDVEGQYGPQKMFTLVDGRKMYLNLNVAERISELRIGPGERFTICKQQTSDGRRRGVEWEIRRVDPAGSGELDRPGPVPSYGAAGRGVANGHSLEGQLRESIEQTQHRRALPPASNVSNGGGYSSSYTAPSLANVVSIHAATMTTMLRASVDSLRMAERYAKEQHGVKLEFNEEDVRTLATTLFIAATREGGLR